jgi:hypothetical protein
MKEFIETIISLNCLPQFILAIVCMVAMAILTVWLAKEVINQ